ncbi:pyridine nucleotide-disulfide oxidoreductase, partial [Pseudomonas aeruginosa]
RIAGLLAADMRDELPVAAPGIAIDCSGPLKLCVPQRPLAALRLPPDTRRLEVAFLTSGH